MGRPRRKAWDGELGMYADARRQGIQPSGTTRKAVEAAVITANETGSTAPLVPAVD